MRGRLAVLCLAAAVGIAGCQTAGRARPGRDDSVCPRCGKTTVPAAVRDLTGCRAICPECGALTAMPGPLSCTFRDYTGGETPDTVRVCRRCGAAVASCAECRHAQRR